MKKLVYGQCAPVGTEYPSGCHLQITGPDSGALQTPCMHIEFKTPQYRYNILDVESSILTWTVNYNHYFGTSSMTKNTTTKQLKLLYKLTLCQVDKSVGDLLRYISMRQAHHQNVIQSHTRADQAIDCKPGNDKIAPESRTSRYVSDNTLMACRRKTCISVAPGTAIVSPSSMCGEMMRGWVTR